MAVNLTLGAVRTRSGKAYLLGIRDQPQLDPELRAHLSYALREWGFEDVRPLQNYRMPAVTLGGDDGSEMEQAVTIPLGDAEVTATMTVWMVVDAFGQDCLFGFARWHPNTGGLSYVLSTSVTEFTEAEDRARTGSGRVYSLGRQVSFRDLDEEGQVALRLLLDDDPSRDPGAADDIKWVSTRKRARHLGLSAPPRSDPSAVEHFWNSNFEAYLKRRSGSR